MKKIYLIIFLFSCITGVSQEQKRITNTIQLNYYQVAEYGSEKFKDFLGGITNTVSYNFNKNFNAGLGTGFQYIRYSRFIDIPYSTTYVSKYKLKKIAYIPIYAEIRVNFIKDKVSPYFLIDYGYSIGVYKDFGNGMMLNSMVGIKIPIKNNKSIDIGLGGNLQRTIYTTHYHMTNGNPSDPVIIIDLTQRVLFHFIGLKFGVTI